MALMTLHERDNLVRALNNNPFFLSVNSLNSHFSIRHFYHYAYLIAISFFLVAAMALFF